ncbi:nuclear transport factor 2 family protein [Gammaproteobacteria bacterium]|nr:nuclear transport factor 2 family protein [Gammaproteobacteria bacterium]MDA8720101.1 nuclear transport factor 2 family protein [bacterium]MDA7851591.1 nuclear transport factor 2 family protein [Gammaproteobacteria bacterium]MDA9048422.1 nuclear transport factor 2 family protein [Gammaproteobacteria bacterium]MDA9340407.1 nuclear transport factor 2 family protein [Gammaproteobacteria bacterium]|tara:strand:- start:1687 stop:2115 length:429 start_codon:yes stop_codon:yes gene_type:complete
MKQKVQSALDNYVLAYSTNDKDLFLTLWDPSAIFEDPVGAEPCDGIQAISEFWDFGHVEGMTITPTNVKTIICSNEGILQATMEVRNTADNTGMNIAIVDHFVINETGKIISGRAFWDENSISQLADAQPSDINLDDFMNRS